MGRKRTLTKVAELETLPVFRQFIAEFCEAEEVEQEICFDLQLAVDEASTNVITHGYEGLNPGSICLSLRKRGDKVLITLTDFGHPFEPSQAPTPDVEAALEERTMGGFGLFFIYESMDEVDYRITEEGNILLLTKKL